MYESLIIGLLLVSFGSPDPAVAARDTTFTVPGGARVTIYNPDGDIQVLASDGPRGRALMEDEDDAGIRLRRRGDTFEIRPAYGDGDMIVELPADVTLEILGGDGNILIRGFRGSIVAETFDGDVLVDGGTVVAVHSVDGDVRVRNVSASVTVDMGDGDAHIRNVGGPFLHTTACCFPHFRSNCADPSEASRNSRSGTDRPG